MAGEFRSAIKLFRSIFALVSDFEKLLPLILDLVIDETNAEHCRIVLYDGDNTNRWRRRGAKKGSEATIGISSEIIQRVKDSREVFVTSNAMEDSRLNKTKSIITHRLLSVACAPLWEGEKIFGVLYIDNLDEESAFDKKTGALLTDLADSISEALKKSIEATLQQRLERERLQKNVQDLRDEVAKFKGYGEMVGTSPTIQRIYEDIERIKDIKANILITGESGTGKELVARSLHNKSSHSNEAFVAVDCSAIPDTLLESELFGTVVGAYPGAIDKPALLKKLTVVLFSWMRSVILGLKYK